MKEIIYGMLLLLLMTSCGNNSKKRLSTAEISAVDSVEVVKEKLHPAIVEGIINTVSIKEHLKFPEIPLDESFIAVEFIVDAKDKVIYFSDSTIRVTYYFFPGYEAPIGEYYKGVLEDVEGYNVGVFDPGGFGEKYYNKDSIKYIPLERFKHYPMTVIFSAIYYLKNGELLHWCP